MIKKKMLLVISFLFSTISTATVVDYPHMGKQALSAFECSHLAALSQDSLINNKKEVARLFLYGYKTGKEFLKAIESDKNKSDKFRHTPMIFIMIIQEGQSSDFMLGRLYEWSQSEVIKKNPNSYKDEGYGASLMFQNKNCSLIGR
ncbi:hypothetical protein OAT39_03325 [Candidatus Thioglobus sp.]|jgi:hypothetical protein|nr:hypothetical protein [Candidatus Thioglobus sp.]